MSSATKRRVFLGVIAAVLFAGSHFLLHGWLQILGWPLFVVAMFLALTALEPVLEWLGKWLSYLTAWVQGGAR